MFAMFQDIAALHAENLGAAVDWLYREHNLAWILMRVRVEIDNYPTLAQDLLVDTWPQKPRALYERDYRIRDVGGEVLVRAASTWIIMNLGTREIKRDIFFDYYGIDVIGDRALGKGVGRLKPLDGAELVYEKEVKYSDVDYNVHTNNAKYVDLIMDAIPVDEHRSRVIKAIEVHYVNETGPGDILSFRRKKVDEHTDYIECIRKSDEAMAINGLVEWE
jgi:acyl-ACP thioesterase